MISQSKATHIVPKNEIYLPIGTICLILTISSIVMTSIKNLNPFPSLWFWKNRAHILYKVSLNNN